SVVIVRGAEEHQVFECGQLRAQPGEEGCELEVAGDVVAHQYPGPGLAEHVEEFALAVDDVEGHQYRADAHGGHIGHQPGRIVGRSDGDPVSVADAQPGPRRGQTVYLGGEVRVPGGPGAGPQQRRIRCVLDLCG